MWVVSHSKCLPYLLARRRFLYQLAGPIRPGGRSKRRNRLEEICQHRLPLKPRNLHIPRTKSISSCFFSVCLFHDPRSAYQSSHYLCPDTYPCGFLLVFVFLDHVNRFFDVAQNQVAMAVICLQCHSRQSRYRGIRGAGGLTWRRPFSSRSPRSFTNTISSRDRRTRSRGSETEAPASSVSAIVGKKVGGNRGQQVSRLAGTESESSADYYSGSSVDCAESAGLPRVSTKTGKNGTHGRIHSSSI